MLAFLPSLCYNRKCEVEQEPLKTKQAVFLYLDSHDVMNACITASQSTDPHPALQRSSEEEELEFCTRVVWDAVDMY